MFRTVPLSIIRIFFLVHTAMVYVVQVCWQLSARPVWHIPLLRVQWKTRDGGQRKCPKYVEFYPKNKFEKLVYPVRFVIRKAVVYVFTRWNKTLLNKTKMLRMTDTTLASIIFITMECSTQKYQNFTQPIVKTLLFKSVNLSYSKFLQRII